MRWGGETAVLGGITWKNGQVQIRPLIKKYYFGEGEFVTLRSKSVDLSDSDTKPIFSNNSIAI
jgi:hypothetical protein